MKRITNIICLAFICMAMACNDAAKTDDSVGSSGNSATNASTTDETPTLKDTAAIMQAWMTYATTGEPHAMMAKDVGTWDVETTHWMTPDAQPQTSKGTAVNTMILDGHYQQSLFKGDMGGMPFNGISTLAYDNAKKKYINTWIDNMGTGLMVMEGTYDAGTKTYNFSGKCTDIRTGKDCTVRETFQLVDDNTQKMEMFMTYPGGKEYKGMEITYKRKK